MLLVDEVLDAPAFEDDPVFRADVLAGLADKRRAIPPKYFYDAAGSELFEQITARR